MRVRRGRSVQAAVTLLGCFAWALSAAVTGFAAEAPPYYSSFGPDGTATTGFVQAGSIAIDQEFQVAYVIDNGQGLSGEGSLYKFDAEGHPVDFDGSASYISGNRISGLSFLAGARAQVAVNPANHDIYVTQGEFLSSESSLKAFHADGEPAGFAAGPGAGGNSIGFGSESLQGLAADINGNI